MATVSPSQAALTHFTVRHPQYLRHILTIIGTVRGKLVQSKVHVGTRTCAAYTRAIWARSVTLLVELQWR